jgi:hypothetical protein
MQTILAHAQQLVYTLLSLMPSEYQRDNLQAMLGLFLEALLSPLPQHSKTKSASALSRFLNIYSWSTRKLIRTTRDYVLQQLLAHCPKGRRAMLQVIIDLTTLEKSGKFKLFEHLISVYNGKRGLHLVVLYLVVGYWRVPWSFRVWRGKDTPSPAQLGLKLVKGLPPSLTKRYQVMILVDTAFGTVDFLQGIRQLKYHVIAGVRCDRQLIDGRSVCDLYKRGQQVRLVGLKFPVSVSWYYLKRDNGKKEKRFVLSTKQLKGSTITWWGRRRWQIEGWFKTVKHRFGLHRFGQGTLVGVYRWLVLSLIAYLLAHWAYLSSGTTDLPDWGQAAQLALQAILPQLSKVPFFT